MVRISARSVFPRLWRLAALWLIALAIALPLPVSPFTSEAQAQQVRERRSIIDLLFRGERPRVYRKRPAATAVMKIRRKKPKLQSLDRADPLGASSSTTDVVTVKRPDAKKVLVIGDFMASALADGLNMATVSDAGIAIEKGTDGSSGLVRTDHLDWPVTLKAQIEKLKPALIVIMLGSNDRQQMSVNGQKEKFRSEAWNNEYEKRISAVIAVATQNKVPFIWTGLPSFQSPSLSADAATLNSLYRTKAEMAGGVFIDIWDGFADENGKFIASGSDINGQPVRLRGSDGLSLTKAGKRKMAFYLEKDMKRLIGADPAALGLVKLDASNLPLDANATSPTFTNILTVPPVSLVDPELDGTNVLLDTDLMPKTSGKSPRDLLIEKGETGDAPEGRVDDFHWKPAAKKPAG
jgi:uncharacterized protein